MLPFVYPSIIDRTFSYLTLSWRSSFLQENVEAQPEQIQCITMPICLSFSQRLMTTRCLEYTTPCCWRLSLFSPCSFFFSKQEVEEWLNFETPVLLASHLYILLYMEKLKSWFSYLLSHELSTLLLKKLKKLQGKVVFQRNGYQLWKKDSPFKENAVAEDQTRVSPRWQGGNTYHYTTTTRCLEDI